MKKILIHIGLIIPLILFVVHQLTEMYFQLYIPIADNYLDPFCASVIILHALALERKLIFDWSLTLFDIVLAILVLSIFSEVVFPYFSERFTADLFDIIAFALGAVWFVLLRNDLIVKDNS